MFDNQQKIFQTLVLMSLVLAMFSCVGRADGVNTAIAVWGLYCSYASDRKNELFHYLILLALTFVVDLIWFVSVADDDPGYMVFAVVMSAFNFLLKFPLSFFAYRFWQESSASFGGSSGGTYSAAPVVYDQNPSGSYSSDHGGMSTFNPTAPSGYQNA
eukprot:Rmarinus@m.10530